MRALPVQLATKLYGAAELMADQGLDNTKIDDIAEASGVPKATLYYYFAGKEEILAFLLKDLLTAIAGDVAVAVAADGQASERLVGVVRAQLDVMVRHPALCRALVGDLGRATRLPELAAALSAAFYEPVEELLREGAKDGSLRATEDPMSEAVMIFGTVTVVGLMEAIFGPQNDPENIARGVSRLLLDGLAPRNPGKASS
ncbi:AcrR family transcriptional regulator [Aeromicrobium panaciterrae]|uniref:AcrR family transcriptional regulator n=1 Tax=Aeromicrobium panaciterrae TaxID=363861 RepID=A0ABU1UKP0_9ACTN|nr:TetR/AcrR family transcriptional regulator [Aeromicrobium panaciterrae]MDR7085757.1 AcrR family transcriptional regulator [Aeromicrobium panaciterrae]